MQNRVALHQIKVSLDSPVGTVGHLGYSKTRFNITKRHGGAILLRY